MSSPSKTSKASDKPGLHRKRFARPRSDISPYPSDEESESDEEEMLELSSQQSITQRIRALPKNAKGGLSGLLPKKKPSSPVAAPSAPSKRKKKNTAHNGDDHHVLNNPNNSDAVRPSRSSVRLRKKTKPSYGYLLEPDDDDDDFEDGKPHPNHRNRAKRKRKKRRARSPLPAPPSTPPPPSSSGGPAEDSGAAKPLVLNITAIKRRKAHVPSEKMLVKWEVARRQLTDEDRSILGIIFREHYKAPVNCAETAARFRTIMGRDPTEEEQNELFAINKPWGDKYSRFQETWTDLCRTKKQRKPANKNPKLFKSEVKVWFKEFVKEYGIIQSSKLPLKYTSKKELDKFYRKQKGLPTSDDEDDADFQSDVGGIGENHNENNERLDMDNEKYSEIVPRRSPRKRAKTVKYKDFESSLESQVEEEEDDEENSAEINSPVKSGEENEEISTEKKERVRKKIIEEEEEPYANGNAKRSRPNPIEVEVDGTLKIPLKDAAEKLHSSEVLEMESRAQEKPMESLDGKKDGSEDSVKEKGRMEVCEKTPSSVIEKKLAEIGIKTEREETSNSWNVQMNMGIDESCMAGAANRLETEETHSPKKDVEKIIGDVKRAVEDLKEKKVSKPFRIRRKKSNDGDDKTNKWPVVNKLKMDEMGSQMATRWEDGRIVKED